MSRNAKIWLVVGIIMAVLLCCCAVSLAAVGIFRSVFNMTEIIDMATSGGNPNVTLANYNRVQIGMTYKEVAAIFGSPGFRTAQIKMGGKWMEFYQWMGPNGCSALITFKNDRVTDKSQSKLE